ncbi:hypothetical protein BJX64DRAFT_294112 [Aspergillus heterothallicus]
MAQISASTSYSFTISNRPGVGQSYAIFSRAPTVEPFAQGLTSHAILIAHGVASISGTAFVSIPRGSYYAICGTTHQDEAITSHVFDRRPVTLSVLDSPVPRHGTTCVTQVLSDGLSFALWSGPAGDRGEVSAFCIQTGSDFTYEQATTNNFILGLGLSTSGTSQVGLYASFTPSPRTTYQVTPSKLFYVAAVKVQVNAPIRDEDLSNACQVDFSTRSPYVKLVHSDNNAIEVVDSDFSSATLSSKL